MIELKNDALIFRFPEVHRLAECRIEFQRTLRIPDDNRPYALPPGLGRFPLRHIEDHAARLPETWVRHGGVMLPMYQGEALWVNFGGGHSGYPFAVMIAAGKINAVTGDTWSNGLRRKLQNYVVTPDQPWLDGFCVKKGLVRQFVAMPLGEGYTTEEQLTGTAEHGGLQIVAFPMKAAVFEKMMRRTDDVLTTGSFFAVGCAYSVEEMGLAPGGLMRQEIYEDHHGKDAWETGVSSRCFIHLMNSAQWRAATGTAAPGRPPTASDYSKAGLPWFEYYGEQKASVLDGLKRLAGLDSVAAMGVKKGETPLPENDPVTPTKVVTLGPGSGRVSEGEW